MTRRIRHMVAVVFALVGIYHLGQGGWIEAKAWLAHGLIDRAWANTRATGRPTQPWPWADTWPVARLRVPALGIERTVLHGASGRTLAFGPAWDSASAPPGGAGVVLLSGHRDTHFRFLAELAPGARLRLEGIDGPRDYVVEGAKVVDVRRDRLVDPGGVDALLLVTCYPFDTLRAGGPLRYAVTARPLPESRSASRPGAA